MGAVLLEQNDEWQLQHRYMQVEVMAERLRPPPPIPGGSRARPSQFHAIHCAVERHGCQKLGRSAAVNPAAAQRCAKGAGLDSGAPDAAQSAMPSIATPAASPTVDHFHQGRCACAASAQSRISTSLTDVTGHSAHIGQEVEVHYRWHAHYGRRLRRQYVERRAGGDVVHVEVTPGVVVVVAAWMLDPAACAGRSVPRASI